MSSSTRLAAILQEEGLTKAGKLLQRYPGGSQKRGYGGGELWNITSKAADTSFGSRGWWGENRRDTYAVVVGDAPAYRGAHFKDLDPLIQAANEDDVVYFLKVLRDGLKKWAVQNPDAARNSDYQPRKIGLSYYDDDGERQSWAIDLGDYFESVL